MSDENFNQEQDVSLDEQIEGILDNESENTQSNNKPDKETETQTEDEIVENKPQCPEEFLNQDGTIKIDDLIKSYNELQVLGQQKEEWEKEKTDLQKQVEYAKQLREQALFEAQNLGYQTPEEYAFVLQIANATADEYMKYLHTVEEPDKVRGLLALYAKNPTPELLEQIEDEFSVDVVKHVSVLSERTKNQVLQNLQQQRLETIKQEAETFVQNSVKDFPQWFKIPEFTEFFADALRIKGDAFETATFVKHIENLKEYFRKEFLTEQNANKENKSELDSLKNLAPKTKQGFSTKKNVEDYSPEELDRAIEELI